jgi:hypothetical protein
MMDESDGGAQWSAVMAALRRCAQAGNMRCISMSLHKGGTTTYDETTAARVRKLLRVSASSRKRR